MSASNRPDHTCSLGSCGSSCRCHWQLFHASNESRHKPRPHPCSLPDTESPCCTAPSGPRACQDLPHTGPICPLLTCCVTWAEQPSLPSRSIPCVSPRPGQGVMSVPALLLCIQDTDHLQPDIKPLTCPHMDYSAFKAKLDNGKVSAVFS